MDNGKAKTTECSSGQFPHSTLEITKTLYPLALYIHAGASIFLQNALTNDEIQIQVEESNFLSRLQSMSLCSLVLNRFDVNIQRVSLCSRFPQPQHNMEVLEYPDECFSQVEVSLTHFVIARVSFRMRFPSAF